jgi:hypothetical protein
MAGSSIFTNTGKCALGREQIDMHPAPIGVAPDRKICVRHRRFELAEVCASV